MRASATATVALACAACAPAPPPMPLLQGTERVEVKADGGGTTLATITEPAKVDALVAFVNARREGWGTPWAGVPVPRVRADFYGAKFQGHFGAGPGFFETQRAGGFWSRDADDDEIAVFARLAGVPVERIR